MFEGKYIVAHLFLGNTQQPKLGLTVSRRFGKAVKRSHFKRLVREAFRISLPLLPSSLEIHIRPRQCHFLMKMAHIQQELISSLRHVT